MNNTSFVFEIKNLCCQYDTKKVLEIKHLNIPANQLIFILGVSGVGKSTFIETLGLMNNTIATNSDTLLRFAGGNTTPIEIQDIWQQTDDVLSEFRNQHFSFIFQNTNLMPNFSAGENMCISRLLRGDSLANAKKEVLKVMTSLDLDREIFDKSVTELSGGQRQRLAFVRAVTSDFTVLFGDEPTGNLDKSTAHKLLYVLKSYLKKGHRTGIIVSHDIDLAFAFADQIILLSKNENDKISFGEILTNNIFKRVNNEWKDNNDNLVLNPESLIMSTLINHRA